MTKAPLHGLRILDLTTVVMGPYASQLIGEYGAEVIKIEAPCGDSTRHIGPGRENGMAGLFMGVNRHKASVVIDLKSHAGREALLSLVDTADVLMHNMRPNKMEALGLGAEEIRARNRRLVYASLTGFASDGPYAGQPAYDDVIQGLAGFAGLMEMQAGVPRYIPAALADKVGSLFAVQAVLTALLQRERTGYGACVEVPMFEAAVSFGLVEHMQGGQFEPPIESMGYRRAMMPGRRPYETRDGHVCVMPYTDVHWQTFLLEVGDTATLEDPRFATLSERTRNIELLYTRLAEHILTRSTQEWISVCHRLDIPVAPMNRLEDLRADPHLCAVEHFVTVDDADMGRLVFPRNPVRFDGWRSQPTMPPRLGQDTERVLNAVARRDGDSR